VFGWLVCIYLDLDLPWLVGESVAHRHTAASVAGRPITFFLSFFFLLLFSSRLASRFNNYKKELCRPPSWLPFFFFFLSIRSGLLLACFLSFDFFLFFFYFYLVFLLLYIGRLRFDYERGPTPMIDGCIHFLKGGERDSKLVLPGSAAY